MSSGSLTVNPNSLCGSAVSGYTELSGSGAWEHALTCAENVREELDIEGVPPEKLQELESSEDRVIILGQFDRKPKFALRLRRFGIFPVSGRLLEICRAAYHRPQRIRSVAYKLALRRLIIAIVYPLKVSAPAYL